MNYLERIIGEIELHSIGGIKECFEHGVSPNDLYRGQPLIYELISEYTRTPRFRDCVKLFVDYGLEFEDKALLSVLLNHSVSLERQITIQPEIIARRYTLQSAYTPLHQATLMHICAEFNHAASAKVLTKYGADVNAKAGTDENGFGGQTPVYHTVNQNSNNSIDMLNFLLAQSADLEITVAGIIWGKGYEWETLIPAVNPISYAMMGLLPQMHRNEIIISNIVAILLKHSFRIEYTPKNVPNAYLKH
ncbi:MAG: hypothetical protein WD824_25730 [Cyclobacteriaceae bacterium]